MEGEGSHSFAIFAPLLQSPSLLGFKPSGGRGKPEERWGGRRECGAEKHLCFRWWRIFGCRAADLLKPGGVALGLRRPRTRERGAGGGSPLTLPPPPLSVLPLPRPSPPPCSLLVIPRRPLPSGFLALTALLALPRRRVGTPPRHPLVFAAPEASARPPAYPPPSLPLHLLPGLRTAGIAPRET